MSYFSLVPVSKPDYTLNIGKAQQAKSLENLKKNNKKINRKCISIVNSISSVEEKDVAFEFFCVWMGSICN